jgi:hypothetical protein
MTRASDEGVELLPHPLLLKDGFRVKEEGCCVDTSFFFLGGGRPLPPPCVFNGTGWYRWKILEEEKEAFTED